MSEVKEMLSNQSRTRRRGNSCGINFFWLGVLVLMSLQVNLMRFVDHILFANTPPQLGESPRQRQASTTSVEKTKNLRRENFILTSDEFLMANTPPQKTAPDKSPEQRQLSASVIMNTDNKKHQEKLRDTRPKTNLPAPIELPNSLLSSRRRPARTLGFLQEICHHDYHTDMAPSCFYSPKDLTPPTTEFVPYIDSSCQEQGSEGRCSLHWRDLLNDEFNGVSWCLENNHPFREGIRSPCVWHHRIALLNFAQYMLHRWNLTFFLDTGGLIGSMRNGGFELTDDDIDLAVWVHDDNEMERLRMMADEAKTLINSMDLEKQTNVTIKVSFNGNNHINFMSKLNDVDKGNWFTEWLGQIDIFRVNVTADNSSMVNVPVWPTETGWDIADLFPIRQCNFMGRILPCPHRPYTALKKWKSPKLKDSDLFLPPYHTLSSGAYPENPYTAEAFLISSNRSMTCLERFGFPTLRSSNPPFKPYFTDTGSYKEGERKRMSPAVPPTPTTSLKQTATNLTEASSTSNSAIDLRVTPGIIFTSCCWCLKNETWPECNNTDVSRIIGHLQERGVDARFIPMPCSQKAGGPDLPAQKLEYDAYSARLRAAQARGDLIAVPQHNRVRRYINGHCCLPAEGANHWVEHALSGGNMTHVNGFRKLQDKRALHNVFNKVGLSDHVPKMYSAEEIKEGKIDFPVFVKRTRSKFGLGTSVVYNASEIDRKLKSDMFVEEALTGEKQQTIHYMSRPSGPGGNGKIASFWCGYYEDEEWTKNNGIFVLGIKDKYPHPIKRMECNPKYTEVIQRILQHTNMYQNVGCIDGKDRNGPGTMKIHDWNARMCWGSPSMSGAILSDLILGFHTSYTGEKLV